MGCASCGTSADGKTKGCNSNGGCSSGGCNKLNTFDWLAKMDISDSELYDIVEVSFKNGSRKAFYQNPPYIRAIIGDTVVVESASGYDVGRISLTGELVRLQMKKKKVSDTTIFPKIIRIANNRDLEKLEDARALERGAMIRARAIARSLKLDMKLGDVEYQGDRRKATFYYTADGRVDFRELIRHYAKEFRVKIEMRQIGARQESSRIGGLGSCGRELCCSTWLTNFKSVTTGAARYQNLAINQSKLSGQCGRLKCCLNYELDTYMDALQDFPVKHERLYTEAGMAVLIKTDIFKRQMVYTYDNPGKRGNFYTLSVDRVKQIMRMNADGEKPMELVDSSILAEEEEVTFDFEDVTGAVELPPEKRRRKSRGGRRGSRNRDDRRPPRGRDDRKDSRGRDDRKDSRGRDDRKDSRGRDDRKDSRGRDDRKDSRGRDDRKDSRGRDDRKDSRGRDDRKDSRGRDDRKDSRGRDDRKGPRRDNRKPREEGKDAPKEQNKSRDKENPEANGRESSKPNDRSRGRGRGGRNSRGKRRPDRPNRDTPNNGDAPAGGGEKS